MKRYVRNNLYKHISISFEVLFYPGTVYNTSYVTTYPKPTIQYTYLRAKIIVFSIREIHFPIPVVKKPINRNYHAGDGVNCSIKV